MKKQFVAVGLFGVASLAHAQTTAPGHATTGNSVDLRLVGSAMEIEDDFDTIEVEGSGFDLRGQVQLTPSLFGRASYLSTESDEVELNGVDVDGDIEFDVLRAGLGLMGANNNLGYFGALEYFDADLTVEGLGEGESGFGASFGLRDAGMTPFIWNVELGILRLEDVDGGMFQADLGYRFNPTVALVGGVQSYALEDDFDVEYAFVQVTLGIRLQF